MGKSWLSVTSKGCRVSVKITPKSCKERFQGIFDGVLKIAIQAPPDKNKANQALIAFLSEEFNIPKSCVEIQSGTTSRNKVIELNGILEDQVLKWVERQSELKIR